MRNEEKIQLGERNITVSELTVSQVDVLMKSEGEPRSACAAELLVDSKLPVEAVCASTDMTLEEINELTPSELNVVWEAVGKVNDFLYRMMERLTGAMQRGNPDHSGEPPVP